MPLGLLGLSPSSVTQNAVYQPPPQPAGAVDTGFQTPGTTAPTKDDMLGPGWSAPQSPSPPLQPRSPGPETLFTGMGGSTTYRPLPQATLQPSSQPPPPVMVARPTPGQIQPAIRQPPPIPQDLFPLGKRPTPGQLSNAIYQPHPDLVQHRQTDFSGGVRPGAMPQQSAVAAARAAQQAQFNRPQGQ